MKSNREYFSPLIRVSPGVDPVLVDLCYDPQTSGGLLIAVAASEADRLGEALERSGALAARIGVTTAPEDSRIVLT
jgi:selenide, water dikinase